MAPELQELHEHAQHGAHDPSMAPVSLTMAILAVAVAVVGLLGLRSHDERLVLKGTANDKWAYYQAKDIRLHEDKQFAELASFLAVSDPARATESRKANAAEIDKYRKQVDELQAEAKQLDQETELEGRRGDRFDFGEIFLDIGLVVTSITLLSGRRVFWHGGVILGIIGVIVASTAALVR